MNLVISKLESLNFKEYEAKILLELIKAGVLSASELAEKTKVKRSTVYDALKKFTAKGYCNEIETNSITQFQIIPPDIIGNKIEKELIKAHKESISAITDVTNELLKVYKSTESDESKLVNVELIRGHNKYRWLKFIELFKLAKSEVLFMVRLEHAVSDDLDDNAKSFLKRGGVIKSVYEIGEQYRIQKEGVSSKGNLSQVLDNIEKFESYGEQAKVSELQLSNITVIDREIVYMNILDKDIPRHNNSDIIIKNKDSAKNFIDLFNFYWDNSHTISEYKKLKHK
ncbi:MAG: winged helix-turn-helix transcriptional regulator [Bacteroidetes bacterium]|nr:winged helix-turn-helix transcriptional regulator [Bacteroidota bacterium]